MEMIVMTAKETVRLRDVLFENKNQFLDIVLGEIWHNDDQHHIVVRFDSSEKLFLGFDGDGFATWSHVEGTFVNHVVVEGTDVRVVLDPAGNLPDGR